MTTNPATPIQAPPSRTEVERALIEALAEIRLVRVAELEAERARGDFEMESPEAIAAIAAVERRFCRRLAQVDDLEPEQLTSLGSLADLLHRRWPTGTPLPSGGPS